VLQGRAASGTRQPRVFTPAAPLKFTGLSGVTAGQRLLQAPTATCSAFNARQKRAVVRHAGAGAPDTEQYMSGVHRTSRQAPKTEPQRSIQRLFGDVAVAPDMSGVHRTVRCAIEQTAPPTVMFGGWGYKYPNHPTIHSIQVLYFPTTTRALASNSRHTKEIKSSPYSTQGPSD
jgi:hypothetical protein